MTSSAADTSTLTGGQRLGPCCWGARERPVSRPQRWSLRPVTWPLQALSSTRQGGNTDILYLHLWNSFSLISYACAISDPVTSSLVLTGGYHSLEAVSRYTEAGFEASLSSLITGRFWHGCGGYISKAMGGQVCVVINYLQFKQIKNQIYSVFDTFSKTKYIQYSAFNTFSKPEYNNNNNNRFIISTINPSTGKVCW